MDIIELQDLLSKTFGERFIFHPKFVEEFIELIVNSGVEKQIMKQFLRRLASIVELNDIDCGLKWLEHLKHYGNLYSLHIDAGNKNFRLLFSKNGNNKYFLRMFYERGGKQTTSYAPNAEIAISRMTE